MTATGLHTRRAHGGEATLLGRLSALPVVLLVLLALGIASQHGHVDETSPDGTRVCTVCHFASETAEATTGTAIVPTPAPVVWVELDRTTSPLPSGETLLATARAPPLDV